MAFAVKMLSDLKQSIADRHESGDIPTDAATLTYWTRLLNKAKDYCADRLTLITSENITTATSGGLNFSALPVDFVSMSAVYESDSTFASNKGAFIMIDQIDFTPNTTGNVYCVSGDQAGGFIITTPGSAVRYFVIEYHFRPSDMSSDSDKCIIPDPEAVVARAYAMLRMAEFDPAEDADKSLGECERRLDEIIYQRNLNSGGTTFKLSEGRGGSNSNWPVV